MVDFSVEVSAICGVVSCCSLLVVVSSRRLIVPLPCPHLPSALLIVPCHQFMKRVQHFGWHGALLKSVEYAKTLLGLTPRVAVRLDGGEAAKTKRTLLAYLLQLESLKQAQNGSASIADDVVSAMRRFFEFYDGGDDDGDEPRGTPSNSLAIGLLWQLCTGAEWHLANDDDTLRELLAMFAAADRPGLGGGSGGGDNGKLPRFIVLEGPADGDIFVADSSTSTRLPALPRRCRCQQRS